MAKHSESAKWPTGEVSLTRVPNGALPGEVAGHTFVVTYEHNRVLTLLLLGFGGLVAGYAVKEESWMAWLWVPGLAALATMLTRAVRIDATTVSFRRWIGERRMDLAAAEKVPGFYSGLVRVRRLARDAELPYACQAALEWWVATREGLVAQAMEQMTLMHDVYEAADVGPVVLLAVRDGAVTPLALSENWCIDDDVLHPRITQIRAAAENAALVAIPRNVTLDPRRMGARWVVTFVPQPAEGLVPHLLVDEQGDETALAEAFRKLGFQPASKGMTVVRGRGGAPVTRGDAPAER